MKQFDKDIVTAKFQEVGLIWSESDPGGLAALGIPSFSCVPLVPSW